METYTASKRQSWLSWFLKGIVILGGFILFSRLIELQIIKGSYFRILAEGNRIRRVPIIAPRGEILARGGEVLVGNRQVKKRVVFNPVEGYEKLDDISEAKEDEITTEWIRDYQLREAFAHAGGYLGEVGPEEVGKINAQCPDKGVRKLGRLIGRSGLEQEYECILRGVDGEELIEVDTSGKRIRTLGRREPVPGESIKTSINYSLQKKVYELMADKPGAVVVTDTNGQVLAIYSSPSFDPNIFVNQVEAGKVDAVLNDKNLPMFNRAIGGLFHPGSVFKPIVAIAALEEGKIDADFVYDDPGQITIKSVYGTFTYSNWYFTQYGRKEGLIGIKRAITRSTDTFFYKIGELTGIEKLEEWANLFGLDEKTGIDIPGEIAGLVPNPQWKLETRNEPWFLGNTYHVSIGQGDIALTLLGVNRAISGIAASGKICTPALVKEPECKNLVIHEANLELVKEGMRGACLAGGTAFTFFNFEEKTGTKVACKTGTAETEEKGKTHAWLSVFGPVDVSAGGPEIVATVMVEKGGEGAYIAGPIARGIFDFWFDESQ